MRFEAAEIESFEPSERFDAVVGQFVLLYMPDPPKALRRFWQWLRDGGVLAFQEMDMSQAAQTPPSPLFEQTVGLIRATFAAGSVECDMGSKLLSAYRVAGLPWPEMCAAGLAGGGPDWPGAELMARTLSSLLPMAERAGTHPPWGDRHWDLGGAHQRRRRRARTPELRAASSGRVGARTAWIGGSGKRGRRPRFAINGFDCDRLRAARRRTWRNFLKMRSVVVA